MELARESWTDERLDDLTRAMDGRLSMLLFSGTVIAALFGALATLFATQP